MNFAGSNPSSYSALIINSSHYQGVTSSLPLTFVSNGHAAQVVLKETHKRFAAIFIDPTVSSPGGIRLIALAKKYRPATPIYLLYDHTEPLTPEILEKMGVQGAIQTPLSTQKVRDRITNEIFDFYFDPPGPPQTTDDAEDRLYLAVPASDFLTGTPAVFDVFVRLPSGRYFKILSAGDVFSPDRVLNYLSKGVSHFFVKKAQHEGCLNYCETLAQFLLSQPGVSFEMKVSDVFNKGQDAVENLRTGAFGPVELEYLETYLANLRALVVQMNLADHRQIRAFLNNLSAYDRAISTTMICALLALPLKIETETAFRTVGLAALLHDVGLYQLPKELQEGDEAQMTAAQRALYQTHPRLGVEILSRLPGIDEVILQAVAQHHERRNRKGFPGTTAPDRINRIAEMIGISDEFMNLLVRAKNDISLNPIQAMVDTVFDGFSWPVIESFRTLFMNGFPGAAEKTGSTPLS